MREKRVQEQFSKLIIVVSELTGFRDLRWFIPESVTKKWTADR